MNEQTEEQKYHFSPDRNHWCIVKYYNGSVPLYYQGFFGAPQGFELKPSFGFEFDQALKCHSKIEAERILGKLNRHAQESVEGCKVEDHKWM